MKKWQEQSFVCDHVHEAIVENWYVQLEKLCSTQKNNRLKKMYKNYS